ncbi:hypothetical protein COZ41_01270 [Candidatus Shapirobacteria bacterium CG_4_10_14_3_um_filter_35_13]|uniref:Uncharacterized protein n=1 Tax=Candidatus Shapirobacteria bacterium CG_4_10_14_3_um_filter_35_13 TaxID=1974873 RepID=A0A2M7LJ90_9BACT|nr:MAG: hypothetical protein COZ41_01270 [Candidatus Shapirobacteria bacterium CG_4_10_14_3_um_filter_35_13]
MLARPAKRGLLLQRGAPQAFAKASAGKSPAALPLFFARAVFILPLFVRKNCPCPTRPCADKRSQIIYLLMI